MDPNAAVVAQFDPTNPIPVLQLVPSPTALAEKAGGGLSVAVQPCEVPAAKECLALVTGWPTTTPITLFFSGDLEEASIPEGIKLFEVQAAGAPTPVAFSATASPRPAPNEACADGGNGSASGAGYDPDTAIPPGNQLVLTPNTPLKPGTQYLLFVESYTEGGAVKGLRDTNGARVEPAALFSLLNTPADAPPVEEVTPGSFEISSALLRANVSSLVLAGLFPNKTLADLTPEQKTQLDTVIAGRAQSLAGLYRFFSGTIGAGAAAGLTKRENVIFANTWHTGPASAAPVGGEVQFDPLMQKVPFPNAQLLTANSTSSVQVTIPVNPCGAMPTPGCDSPTAAALKGGLNTLDGFSTTAPITVPFSSNIDEATVADNIFMYRVGANGMAGAKVNVRFETKTATGAGSAELRIIPVLPLDQNATYVLAIKRGIKGTDGNNFRRPQTFNFLAVRQPLLTEDGDINPAALVSLAPGAPAIPVRLPLQCAPVSLGQPFPTPEAVVGQATQIEVLLRRARWAEALDVLATVAPAIPEDDILMAWTHKTQSITRTVDAVKAQLLPTVYQAVRTASGTPAIQLVTELLTPQQIQGTIAVTFCRSGGLAPAIPPADCLVNGAPNPAIFTNPIAQSLLPLFTAGIGSMRLYLMANYVATRGNPLSTGGTFLPRIGQAPSSVEKPNIIQTPIWVITSTNTRTAPKVPVIVFQHGLGSQKEAGFFIASTFAQAGYATVLMDLPFHGTRASDLVGPTGVCADKNPDIIRCNSSGACTNGCDGVQDSSGTGFLSSNVFAARDNFRQSIIDQLTLIRLIQTESMAMGELSYLDGAHIAYAGQSLGGITGGNLAAYAGELEASVLNVPGGGLVNILLGTVPAIAAPLFAALAQAGVCTPTTPNPPVVGCQDTAAFRQFQTSAQWALDPGDPLANSIGVTQSRGTPVLGTDKVLIQMVTPDKVIPNATTMALGASYGFTPADNSMTSHYQTYDFSAAASPQLGSGCHAFLLAPTPTCQSEAGPTAFLCATIGAQQQTARFIASRGTTVGTRAATVPGLCN